MKDLFDFNMPALGNRFDRSSKEDLIEAIEFAKESAELQALQKQEYQKIYDSLMIVAEGIEKLLKSDEAKLRKMTNSDPKTTVILQSVNGLQSQLNSVKTKAYSWRQTLVQIDITEAALTKTNKLAEDALARKLLEEAGTEGVAN